MFDFSAPTRIALTIVFIVTGSFFVSVKAYDGHTATTRSSDAFIGGDVPHDRLSQITQLLSSNNEDKQLSGLQVAERLKSRLRGHGKVVSLITELTHSSNKKISLYAVGALAFIEDESSRKVLESFLDSPNVAKTFFAAAGLLEMPGTDAKQAGKAVSTLVELTKTPYDTALHQQIILGILDELGRLAHKADMEQPAIPTSTRKEGSISEEAKAGLWEQFAVQLREWWSQHQDKIVLKLYTYRGKDDRASSGKAVPSLAIPKRGGE